MEKSCNASVSLSTSQPYSVHSSDAKVPSSAASRRRRALAAVMFLLHSSNTVIIKSVFRCRPFFFSVGLIYFTL